jgi:hypothetical protein
VTKYGTNSTYNYHNPTTTRYKEVLNIPLLCIIMYKEMRQSLTRHRILGDMGSAVQIRPARYMKAEMLERVSRLSFYSGKADLTIKEGERND